MSGSEDTSTPSKRRGPYLRYLADPAAKVPKVSNWRKQGPCNMLSTIASQHVGVSEISRTAPPPNVSISDVNSVNEPVEYPGPFGHASVLPDSTDEEGWENCVDKPVQVTYTENEVQVDDCLFEPALSSSSLSAADDDSEKFADDEEFEYVESDDEMDTTGTVRLIFLLVKQLIVICQRFT